MSLLSNIVNKFTASSSNDDFPSTVPFTDDPCISCEEPCTAHPQIPDYLQKKIEGGPLVGTMKPYKRHILVIEGTSKSWPEKVDEAEGMTKTIAQEVDKLSSRAGYRTIVTACDPIVVERTEAPSSVTEVTTEKAEAKHAVSVLIFPDDVSVKVAPCTTSTLVQSLLNENKLPEGIESESLDGRAWIFVCTHRKRDKRCGVAGPLLVDEFRNAVGEMGLEKEVYVYGCSHFGGHKYAGNVIIYHRDSKLNGNWYGRVRTCHVRPILKTTVLEGKVFKELWRGAMDKTESNSREW